MIQQRMLQITRLCRLQNDIVSAVYMDINKESKGMSLLIPRSFLYDRNQECSLNVELYINFFSSRGRKFTSDTGNFVNDN